MYRVSIVIPTFNRKDHLQELLYDLLNQVYDKVKLKIGLLIVVDGSSDGTIEMLKLLFPEVEIIYGDGTWWFTRSIDTGCRIAFEKFNSDFVITLNDDVRLNSNYIQTILINEKISNDVIIGSISLDNKTKSTITFSGIANRNVFTGSYITYLPYGTKFIKEKDFGFRESLTLPTRGTLIPKKVFESVKGFDLSFPQYASDYDFVLKAKKQKIKIYISYDAVVYEKTDATGSGSPRINKSFYKFIKEFLFNKYSPTYIKNNIRMIWRYQSKVLFFWYVLIMFLGTLRSYFKYD